MKAFNKRISQKLSKLSDVQIEDLFESISNDREIFGSIIESLSIGLLILDSSWKIIVANTVCERYLPLSARIDNLKNDGIMIWEAIKDEDISRFLIDCHKHEKTNVSEEFSILTSGGTTRFINVALQPLVQSGKVDGTIISIRDITEKRRQEVRLHRMESLASLTTLAANVAHEIKNPLGAISIHIQLMQKAVAKARNNDGMLPPEKFMEKYLDVVNEEIDNLNKIVVDFLFAVRPVSANLELKDPDKLLERFRDFFLPEFQQKKIRFTTRLCNKSVRLLIDEKLFREVIVNLTQNAIAAIDEKNSGDGELEIITELKNDIFVIRIKDNGQGMPENILSHVFEPYYTTKANGTGLGLTMVYKIIKEFSGDIQVTSVCGEGTVFEIKLPVPQMETKLIN